jgi:hypothetical protein
VVDLHKEVSSHQYAAEMISTWISVVHLSTINETLTTTMSSLLVIIINHPWSHNVAGTLTDPNPPTTASTLKRVTITKVVDAPHKIGRLTVNIHPSLLSKRNAEGL